MSTRGLLLALTLILALSPLAGAPIPAAAQEPLPDLTLFLGYIPNIQFAPVYMALERGYFAEAGVNVVLEYGDENLGVERLALDDLHFGLISGEQVILARNGGRPLVYVFEWYQQNPVGVIAPVSTGITTAADLVGRTVGVPGRFGASYTGLRALLAANGLTEDDIDLQEIGFNAPAMLCADRVEASVVYLPNEPVQVRDQCADVNVIAISPQVDLLANGLVTNEQTIAADPDLVRGMVNAFARGLADVIADPDAAMAVTRQYVETLPVGGSRVDASIAADEAVRTLHAAADNGGLSAEDAAALAQALAAPLNHDEVIQMQVLLNSIVLWDAPRLGVTDPASWEATMQTLIDMGLLDGPVDLSAAYTNDFLPE
jgi:NitT/TauT family transport system substrate-binding protein